MLKLENFIINTSCADLRPLLFTYYMGPNRVNLCVKWRLWLFLRDYVSNIWGNLWIAVMGAGREVWPKIFFLVHMTMSTGSLASPPPRGGASWCLQIFACFLPVLSLALISCWSMLETCASVSGHHFSHIKSHFNDLKQNFKIWGYLQKRHFSKLSAATKGACKV